MTSPWLCYLQGIYFVATGVWPLLHMRSFIYVTGPKTDLWLVRTVGILVVCIGATLIIQGYVDSKASTATAVLAASSALGLLVIDVTYVRKGTIRKIYLADALLELALLAMWLVASVRWQA